MNYEIILHPQVNDDIKELSYVQQKLVFKQLKKIATSPELGDFLGNRGGYNLSGCRKMYVDNKKVRIVYRIEEERIVVEVIALGKRDEMEVYKKAAQRL
jgi:mRNA interferase RelE/StbE